EVSRVARFPILAQISQFDAVRNLFRFPDHVVKSVWPAVQRILPIIQWQRIFFAPQRKTPVRDSIPIAPDNRSEERASRPVAIRVVAVNIVKPQQNFTRIATQMRSFQGQDDATET